MNYLHDFMLEIMRPLIYSSCNILFFSSRVRSFFDIFHNLYYAYSDTFLHKMKFNGNIDKNLDKEGSIKSIKFSKLYFDQKKV